MSYAQAMDYQSLDNIVSSVPFKDKVQEVMANPVIGYFRKKKTLLERAFILSWKSIESVVANTALPIAVIASTKAGTYIDKLIEAIDIPYKFAMKVGGAYIDEGAKEAGLELIKIGAEVGKDAFLVLYFSPATALATFAATYLGIKAIPVVSKGIRWGIEYLKRKKLRAIDQKPIEVGGKAIIDVRPKRS